MSSATTDLDVFALANTPYVEQALEHLRRKGEATTASAQRLVEAALGQADGDEERARNWLDVAEALTCDSDADGLRAQISYARARIYLQQGDPAAAEASIRLAQERWRSARETVALARSYMGLTQVLALQGRYREAQESILRAIADLPPDTLASAQAHRNYANLLGRQERHREALNHFDRAGEIYSSVLQTEPVAAQRSQVESELAHLSLNRANALMSLDRLQEAELVLLDALRTFSSKGDDLNMGRVQTNLGSLFLRSGRFSEALGRLEGARRALLGSGSGDGQPVSMRRADVLHLEQANTYLALNLLPEAALELDRAIRLFESAEQPRELGQALYLSAIVLMKSGELEEARLRLLRAQTIFEELESHFWRNRTALTLASISHLQGEEEEASQIVGDLRRSISPPSDEDDRIQRTDRNLSLQLALLQIRIELRRGDAEKALAELARLDGESEIGHQSRIAVPHLRVELDHLRGRLALLQSDPDAALGHLRRAEAHLERIEIGLPLEEMRMTYLDDKQELVADILDAELMASGAADRVQEPSRLATLFGVMERSRARTLLDQIAQEPTSVEQDETSLRRQLHWLYNQILDPEQSDAQYESRRAQIQILELQLQQNAWSRASTASGRAELPGLAQLQERLGSHRQMLIYWVSRRSHGPGEVMGLLLGAAGGHLVRRLLSVDELDRLVADFRFQIGRAELGSSYLKRHSDRLLRRTHRALQALYRALVLPFEEALVCSTLHIVPHDILHAIPFHALWDGESYWAEKMAVSYAPSATFALRSPPQPRPSGRRPWAGLALDDPLIPAARDEIQSVARLFADGAAYLGEDADRQNLIRAASEAEILHVATHGLFRPDNPLFSALKLRDGWLDVREIERLPLSARLVVLSACESGAGRLRGRDELVGLARGFLTAGAETVLASLWKVHDASVSELMQSFYTELTGGASATEALRRSQCRAAATGRHPYFWAPFYAVSTLGTPL